MTAWSIQALTGIPENAELWGAYHKVRGNVDSSIWGLGGKLRVASEPERPASLAAGLSYQQWHDQFAQALVRTGPLATTALVSEKEDMKVWHAYLVATKDLTMKKSEKPRWGFGGDTHLLANAGLMYIKLDGRLGGNESLTRPFLSAELVGGLTEAALEYRFKDDSLDQRGVFSALIRQKFSSDFTLEVGTTNADPVGIGLNDQEIFVRLGYLIPSKSLY
jgi:hypothetical protein